MTTELTTEQRETAVRILSDMQGSRSVPRSAWKEIRTVEDLLAVADQLREAQHRQTERTADMEHELSMLHADLAAFRRVLGVAAAIGEAQRQADARPILTPATRPAPFTMTMPAEFTEPTPAGRSLTREEVDEPIRPPVISHRHRCAPEAGEDIDGPRPHGWSCWDGDACPVLPGQPRPCPEHR